MHNKGFKKFFYFTDINVYKTSIFFFHFFVIWLLVKYKDFLIIGNLSQISHVFALLSKDKLNAQQESATCLLRTKMFVVHKLVKDIPFNQLTISDWSKDIK